MPPSRLHDLSCVLRGAGLVARAVANGQVRQAELRWQTSSLRPTVESSVVETSKKLSGLTPGSVGGTTGSMNADKIKAKAMERSSDIFGRINAVADGLRQGAPALVKGFVDNFGPPPGVGSIVNSFVGGARPDTSASTSASGQEDPPGTYDYAGFENGFPKVDGFPRAEPVPPSDVGQAVDSPASLLQKSSATVSATSAKVKTPNVNVEEMTFEERFFNVDDVFDEPPPNPEADKVPSSSKNKVVDEIVPPVVAKPLPAELGSTSSLPPKPATATTRSKPKFKPPEPKLNAHSRERTVPASRIARLYNYGTLGVGLGFGALGEVMSRTLGMKDPKATLGPGDLLSDNPFLTEANAERIVDTLCRVRGAALKLGQMLSIADNSMISPQLQQIFERVRYAADFMPTKQVHKVMIAEYGPDWRDKFASFEDKPFAAASIGQVHKAVATDGRVMALKMQYPGVAQSIDSDINNLMTLLNFGQLLPKGLYIDVFAKVARKEMAAECDYEKEAASSKFFKTILADNADFYVPEIFDDFTTKQILAAEFIEGVPLDKCMDLDQPTKNWIGESILQLCLNEIFIWRKMQSDPNWSNFFYDPTRGRIVLLDFGATQDYSKAFVDKYIRIIRGAADQNRDEIVHWSREVGFLTGYEPKVMDDAHAQTVMILGEPFSKNRQGVLDFGNQQIASRVQNLMPVMLQHRLSPPPPETYSIHRKLAGTFLLCAKLKCQINCAPMFERIWADYRFGE